MIKSHLWYWFIFLFYFLLVRKLKWEIMVDFLVLLLFLVKWLCGLQVVGDSKLSLCSLGWKISWIGKYLIKKKRLYCHWWNCWLFDTDVLIILSIITIKNKKLLNWNKNRSKVTQAPSRCMSMNGSGIFYSFLIQQFKFGYWS